MRNFWKAMMAIMIGMFVLMPVHGSGGSDFDGEGKAEILISSPWGIGILKMEGGALSAPVMAANGARFPGGWLLNTADNRFEMKDDFDGDGRAEILISSPWGIGILKMEGGALSAPVMAANGARFPGGWLLNTADNKFEMADDFDGEGKAEILISSPWGIGILKMEGSALSAPIMAANGARFPGGWLLNTADNKFEMADDFDGDGKAEVLVSSPWGIGILKMEGSALSAPIMAANGARFPGGWLLNTADNRFEMAADFDGDGRAEILISSPWGIGILKMEGGALSAPVMAANGARFPGGWLLNTADNRFEMADDFDGDGKAEILISSPWGIGILKMEGSALSAPVMAANGDRFMGGWLLNTADNRFEMEDDFDGDGKAEILISSPWGIGILKMEGGALSAPVMAANGDRFPGGWLLNTEDNRFI